MVFEIVYEKKEKCGVCGELHETNEMIPHRTRKTELTNTGKVLPAVMLAAILMLVGLYVYPYAANLAGDLDNFVSGLESFYYFYAGFFYA